MTNINRLWYIRGHLKPRQLLLAVELDEQRNINRAAERLAISQPAASKLLKELEMSLGVSLFERLPRGMRPTWYGEILIRHARVVLAGLQQAHDEMMALRSGVSGHVRIGTVTGPGATLVPQVIALMNQRYPAVRISVELSVSTVLVPLLLQGALDLVIGRVYDSDREGLLHFEPIAQEPLSLVVRHGHPLTQIKRLAMRELAQAAWVLPPADGLLRKRFDLLFQQMGLPAPVLGVETLALPVQIGLLLQTDMIAVLSTDVARPLIEQGLLAALPLHLDFAVDAYGIVTRRDLPLPQAAKAMLDLLRETVRQIAAPLPFDETSP